MRVIFAPFPKNKYLKWGLWAVLFAMLILLLFQLRPGMPTLTKEDVLKAVYNTQQATNYKWHVTAEINFKGVKNTLSDVQGEKNQSAVHLKGTFVKVPLDLYQIGDVTYRLDPITKQWIVIKDNDISKEEVLMTELNPVAALYFSQINAFTPLGVDYINDKKAYKIQLEPEVASEYMLKYWKNFNYILWIDKDRKYVVGYEVSAKNIKDDTGRVKMKVIFSDYGKDIKINPPL